MGGKKKKGGKKKAAESKDGASPCVGCVDAIAGWLCRIVNGLTFLFHAGDGGGTIEEFRSNYIKACKCVCSLARSLDC